MFRPNDMHRETIRAILDVGNHLTAAARSQDRPAIDWQENDLQPAMADVNVMVYKSQRSPNYLRSPDFAEDARRILWIASSHIPAERSTAYDPKQVMDGIGIAPRLL